MLDAAQSALQSMTENDNNKWSDTKTLPQIISQIKKIAF